nr:hypothetical protein CFP56_06859 [Quercus suber]
MGRLDQGSSDPSTLGGLSFAGASRIEDEVNFVLHDRHNLECRTGIKVGHFASSVLKKANIVKYGLVELASEVGMDIKEPFGERPDWSARVFSPVQIKDSEETNIEGYGLKELADEVGMHIEEPNGECPDWNAREFSMEQIKYAVHNAILLM